MKCLVERTEYIFDVLTLTELVLNRHRNELIEEGALHVHNTSLRIRSTQVINT